MWVPNEADTMDSDFPRGECADSLATPAPFGDLGYTTTYEHIARESSSGNRPRRVRPRQGSHSSRNSNGQQIPELASSWIAVGEKKRVLQSKIFFHTSLLIATVICSFATYIYGVTQEQRAFEKRFETFAKTLTQSSQVRAENLVNVLEGLGDTITSYALDSNATFPWVVLPHFQHRSEHILQVVGSQNVLYSPSVDRGTRSQWEKWSINNRAQTDAQTGDGVSILPYIYQRSNCRNSRAEDDINTDDDCVESDFERLPEDDEEIFSPVWQSSPANDEDVNWNLFQNADFMRIFRVVNATRSTALTEFGTLDGGEPFGRLVSPVYERLGDAVSPIVGTVSSVTLWRDFLKDILPVISGSIFAVVRNDCGQAATFSITGPEARFECSGDCHENVFDHLVISSKFNPYAESNDRLENEPGFCIHSLYIYPTSELYQTFRTSIPLIRTAVVVGIFFIVFVSMIFYGWVIEMLESRILRRVKKSTIIVQSLFPEQVRKRMMMDITEPPLPKKENSFSRYSFSVKKSERKIPDPPQNHTEWLRTRPIADLFPDATVLMADISGFTAWSSMREPTQVFTLLETMFKTFDDIAKRWDIFKIETIGDCYVAATGLPTPKDDHAGDMVVFALECVDKLPAVLRQLSVKLGPDTATLSMRFGLHSGPVTAGVLRGEKSRFQLFGSTINIAGQVESSGEIGRVHISATTAELLRKSPQMDRWIVAPSYKMVAIKGQSDIETFFVSERPKITRSSDRSSTQPELDVSVSSCECEDDWLSQQIEWNVDVLKSHLLKIIAMRDSRRKMKRRSNSKRAANVTAKEMEIMSRNASNILQEVVDVIPFPEKFVGYKFNPDLIDLEPSVMSQLRSFVTAIACLFRDVEFHCLERASHAVQSANKLLARVVAPDLARRSSPEAVHGVTFGIAGDPLARFACVFSALARDAGADVVWKILMKPMYEDLRRCVYETEEELERFRQLVVNCVSATDVGDEELAALRQKRWDEAFAKKQDDDGYPKNKRGAEESRQQDINRKATIVIEKILQASDVAHAMQHWHVFVKWNERLFDEMYKDGRALTDPPTEWYRREMDHFDGYVLPLARKLAECGVFGVSSDEYINYAMANRREWEEKGREIVKGYMKKYAEDEKG